MKLNKETKKLFLELAANRKIFLEGNILKVIDCEGDEVFENYIKEALEKDNLQRRKRLDITRQIQSQNKELQSWKEENEKIQIHLKESLIKTEESNHELNTLKEEAEIARIEAERLKEEAIKSKMEAERAKNTAEDNLDLMQKRVQFELIGTIIKNSLWVIIGVGLGTTFMYMFAILTGADTQTISSTWSNIVGILLTNAFSIVGTIMGVKYATEKNEK